SMGYLSSRAREDIEAHRACRANSSDNHHPTGVIVQRSADRLMDRSLDLVLPLCAAEVEEQHLVVIMMDHTSEAALELGLVAVAESSEEHRVLHGLPEIAHDGVDLAEPAVVADVVGDQVVA